MQQLIQPLLHLYDRDEARALLRMLVEDLCHESWTRFIAYGCQADDTLHTAINRLATGEPIQHILGYADFCGHRFTVSHDTLIPRPETAELVNWILEDASKTPHPLKNSKTQKLKNLKTQKLKNSKIQKLLDLGTGTGCIAISLALALPHAQVTALDISAPALDIARHNWHTLSQQHDGHDMQFIQHDILSPTPPTLPPQDIIVSNPPYICRKEAADMHTNVLDHDPHLALFVPDEDPLLFYRAIARHGHTLLHEGGRIYFEINAAYPLETSQMMTEMGYTDIEVRNDQYGRPRMLKAILTRP